MRMWQSEHIFDHSWETITQAAWKKYPNPSSGNNVVAIDVLDRQIKDGILTTRRLFTSRFSYPRWIGTIVRISDYLYSVETSSTNLKVKSMVLESTNLSLGNFMTVVERLEYKPHPADPAKTLLTQEAVINIKGLPWIGRLEEYVATMIATNAKKGRHGLELVIKALAQEAADLSTSEFL